MVLSYDKALPLSQKYSDLFSRVETIPLDTTGNFLVSDIRQFRYALDHFFVLSRDEILIFDRQGKGTARINAMDRAEKNTFPFWDLTSAKRTAQYVC